MPDTTTEPRAKYTQKDRDAMAKTGEAMSDGSYPIKDEADLKRAIRAVGRGGADHDQIRAHIITRAKTLGLASLVPDNWNSDGSLKETNGAWTTLEERESANDMYTALQGAVEDALDGQFSSWSIWVQDWTADERVIYAAGGDLWAAGYTFYSDGAITVATEDAVKVRPVTEYVERAGGPLLEWRRRKAEDLRGHLEHREFSAIDLELRDADEDTWKLTGYASVTETPYDVGFYTETIKRGAFKRTLSENPDVQLLVNHEGLPLARTRSGTLRLEERDRGLWVEADLDKHDPDAQRLQRKMARGDIDQMSFAFQPTDQDWNGDYTERTIRAVSIHRGDVSVVNQGANAASTATIRSTEAVQALQRAGGADALITMMREWRDYTLLPLEHREGKTLSGASMEVLTQVLNLISAADDAVDEAQPILAELMGVPNPDADETTDGDEESGEQTGSGDDDDPAQRAAAPARDFTAQAAQRLARMRAGRAYR